MTCSATLVADLVHGFLPEDEAPGVRDHLSSCDACGSEFRRLARERELLSRSAALLKNELRLPRRRVTEVKAPCPARPEVRSWALAGVGIALMICLGVFGFLLVPETLGPAGPAAQARELVDKLRSERIEERTEAAQKLKALGKDAVPELEKAARDPDPEVARRARGLLKAIAISQKLSPSLRIAFPMLEEQLTEADGDDRVWTETLLHAVVRQPNGLDNYPALNAADLEIATGPVLRGAIHADDKLLLTGWIQQTRSGAAKPYLRKWLKDEHRDVRHNAAATLGALRDKDAVPGVMELLRDPYPELRATAASVLAVLGAREAIPAIIPLLKDPGNGPPGEFLLQDPNWTVHVVAAASLCELGSREGVPVLIEEEGDFLYFLNALRRPKTWQALGGNTLEERPRGTRREMIERAAASLAMKVDFGVKPPEEVSKWLDEPTSLSEAAVPVTASEYLYWDLRGAPCQAVIESDRIRILPSADAADFWRKWAAGK